MTFLKKLRGSFAKLFPSKAAPKDGFIHDPETGVSVETDDPLMAAVVAQAFTSGKPVVGNVDKNGKVTIRKLDPH
ncbi:MAG: hypothetical protein ACXW30_04625 [Micavibrio sp.]